MQTLRAPFGHELAVPKSMNLTCTARSAHKLNLSLLKLPAALLQASSTGQGTSDINSNDSVVEEPLGAKHADSTNFHIDAHVAWSILARFYLVCGPC